jgi:hypothetical protein
MIKKSSVSVLGSALVLVVAPVLTIADERTEHFDRDPGWEGHNNRSATKAARTIRQDFGYRRNGTGSVMSGAVGGFITAAAEPAYYAKKLPAKSFDDVLTASGTLACGDGRFHALLGFFNANTLNEWRTPNTIALRAARATSSRTANRLRNSCKFRKKNHPTKSGEDPGVILLAPHFWRSSRIVDPVSMPDARSAASSGPCSKAVIKEYGGNRADTQA